MGVQTMAATLGGGGGGRQGAAVYGLTLNEVESRLGSPLRSMNLDELLRTVLPAAAGGGPGPGSGKKTVDEVWRDIESAARGRQPAAMVGEMTLEDFLSRAGVPVDGAHWLLHQYHPPPRPLPVYGHGGGGGFLSPSQAGGGRKRGAGGEDEDGGGGGVGEKTVERRHKRMIKNRESAARSRARKQAYMNELENKVSRLEEENRRLKELKRLEPTVAQFVTRPEPMAVQYVPEPEPMVVQYLPEPEPEPEPEPKQHQLHLQLRRTISASF